MTQKVGLVFPGQGSQFVGMGTGLAAASPIAREMLAQADQILDFPLTRFMQEGPEEELKKTENAQPAIVAASIAAYEAFGAEKRFAADILLCAGHSLGEYSALYAAGALAFADCLRLVRRRGQLMQQAAAAVSGGMAAVLGRTEEEVMGLCQAADAGGSVRVANINAPGQVVISGSQAGLEAFGLLAREQKVKMIPLAVSGPFHSSFMQQAAEAFAPELEATAFSDARFPVIANVTAEPVQAAAEIRRNLLMQITGSVRWQQSMQKMLALGAGRVFEIGPGKVLRGLMKKISPDIPVENVFTPEEINAVAGE
ncbi:ACP S-malonyltransferase [candidate division FCPU426 bacterium]|nr:ACP S-malonyltransferase [candidate division FCPU426 bacterium]